MTTVERIAFEDKFDNPIIKQNNKPIYIANRSFPRIRIPILNESRRNSKRPHLGNHVWANSMSHVILELFIELSGGTYTVRDVFDLLVSHGYLYPTNEYREYSTIIRISLKGICKWFPDKILKHVEGKKRLYEISKPIEKRLGKPPID